MRNYLVVGTLAVTLVIVGIPSAVSFAAKQVVDTARLELTDPVDVGTFIAEIKTQDFDEVVLESSFVFDGEEIYDFHVVRKDEQDTDVTSDYVNDRKGLLADVKGIKDISGKNKEEVEQVKIKIATFTGTKGNIDKVKKKFKFKNVDVADEARLKEPQPTQKPDLEQGNIFVTPVEAASTQFYPMYKYLPTSGTSYINNSSVAGERYTQQNMTWANNYFASDETYEHKLYLYNYDGKTFLNGASTAYPNCYPTLTYAATSWGSASKPYLDTRFAENLVSCESEELSYTIGAAQASAITTNTAHYTYMRTTYGNDSSDTFKVQAQVGFRNPSTCYTTWCSAKYKIYNVIPSWNTAAPGTKSWTFSGIAPQEAPSNLTISNPTNSSLKLNFKDNTYDEGTVRIERRLSGGVWSEWGYFGLLNYIGNWNWTNTGLQSNTTYCYRLRAKNDLGYSSYSNIACATTQ